MRQGSTHHPSILGNVLGPITLGPSSSHMSGPVRLGRLTREILYFEPRRVEITFNEGGSFAGTYRGHRTDCALVAGLLGWDTDDPRIPAALEQARSTGMDVSFTVGPLGTDHPNTVRFRIHGPSGEFAEVTGTSEGGGAIRVSSIDGGRTDLDGQWPVLLVRPQPGATASTIVEAVERSSPGPRVLCDGPGLLTIQMIEPLRHDAVQALSSRADVAGIRQVKPVTLAPRRGARPDPLFSSGSDLLRLAAERRARICDLAVEYEAGRLGWTAPEIRGYAGRMLSVMRAARDRGLSEDLPLSGGIVKQGGRRLHQAARFGRTVSTGTMTRAAAYAVAGLMEVPCINRNALGAVNALLSADIVLAGVESVIPFDEVVDAVYETGRFRPVQCSGAGGLATTPSGRAFRNRFLQGGS